MLVGHRFGGGSPPYHWPSRKHPIKKQPARGLSMLTTAHPNDRAARVGPDRMRSFPRGPQRGLGRGKPHRGTKSPNRSRRTREYRPALDWRGRGRAGANATFPDIEQQIEPVDRQAYAALTTLQLNPQVQQYDGFAPGHRVSGRTPKMPIGTVGNPLYIGFANSGNSPVTHTNAASIYCSFVAPTSGFFSCMDLFSGSNCSARFCLFDSQTRCCSARFLTSFNIVLKLVSMFSLSVAFRTRAEISSIAKSLTPPIKMVGL